MSDHLPIDCTLVPRPTLISNIITMLPGGDSRCVRIRSITYIEAQFARAKRSTTSSLVCVNARLTELVSLPHASNPWKVLSSVRQSSYVVLSCTLLHPAQTRLRGSGGQNLTVSNASDVVRNISHAKCPSWLAYHANEYLVPSIDKEPIIFNQRPLSRGTLRAAAFTLSGLFRKPSLPPACGLRHTS